MKVLKAFNTISQRFAVGAPIAESDIGPDEPISFADRLKQGFIGADEPAVQQPVEPPAAQDPVEREGEQQPFGRPARR